MNIKDICIQILHVFTSLSLLNFSSICCQNIPSSTAKARESNHIGKEVTIGSKLLVLEWKKCHLSKIASVAYI